MASPATSAAEHMERLHKAHAEWAAVPVGHTPPPPTYKEAVRWAEYAWYLRHDAWYEPPGASRWEPPSFADLDEDYEWLIFKPYYWQESYLAAQAIEDLMALAKKPLPVVRDLHSVLDAQRPNAFKFSLRRGAEVRRQVGFDVPGADEIMQIVKERITDGELRAVVECLAKTHASYQARILEMESQAIALYRRGLDRDAAPSPSRSLERALHRSAMVRHLVRRGFTRLGALPANRAVAEACDCDPDTVRNDWRKEQDFRRKIGLPPNVPKSYRTYKNDPSVPSVAAWRMPRGFYDRHPVHPSK